MSGWGEHLDELAAATGELLATGSVQRHPLTDLGAALAARDSVVVQLRAMVGAVSGVPPYTQVRELTLFDLTQRPAQALHQALSELPRAVEFGAGPQAGDLQDKSLPDYERAWQSARRASLGLETYVGALHDLPDPYAWAVLRDLADIASALPYLDHDLSEAGLTQVKLGEDAVAGYRMLTSPRHHAVRIVAGELRSRLRDTTPTRLLAHPARSGLSASSTRTLARDAPRQPTHDVASRGPAGAGLPTDGPGNAQSVAEAMIRHTHAVSSRGAHLSVPDMRSVARLLQYGSEHAAAVLERVDGAVSGAAETARGLRGLSPVVGQLRDAPAKSMTPPHLDLLRTGNVLQERMEALAEHARRLPAGASADDLRALAAPALEFAHHVPALAGALDLSVRQAIAGKLMLVPGISSEHHSAQASMWVTATMGPHRDTPPQVVVDAGQASVTARRIAPAIRQAGEALARHAAVPSQGRQALVAARRHAGAAQAELRAALSKRMSDQPAVLAGELPSHPRLAPPARFSGPHR